MYYLIWFLIERVRNANDSESESWQKVGERTIRSNRDLDANVLPGSVYNLSKGLVGLLVRLYSLSGWNSEAAHPYKYVWMLLVGVFIASSIRHWQMTHTQAKDNANGVAMAQHGHDQLCSALYNTIHIALYLLAYLYYTTTITTYFMWLYFFEQLKDIWRIIRIEKIFMSLCNIYLFYVFNIYKHNITIARRLTRFGNNDTLVSKKITKDAKGFSLIQY